MSAGRFLTAVLLTGALGAGAASTASADGMQPQTEADLVSAAHGEAYAHAKYWAYAQEADNEHQPAVARLFMRTSHTELHDHFMKIADLAGLVGSDEDNLRDAIAGEDNEATTVYPGYADQAREQGDTQAAALWTELAADEAAHRDAFAQALDAIEHPSPEAAIPDPPTVDAFPVSAGEAQSDGATLGNLFATLRGESFAHAKYMAYSMAADRNGRPRLGRLWMGTAHVELMDHFAHTAVLAGLVGDSATNLRDAIQGEVAEATDIYIGDARRAQAAGDNAAADLFSELARDEATHATDFIRALQTLELGG